MTTALLDNDRSPASVAPRWLASALWCFVVLLGLMYGLGPLLDQWLISALGPNPALGSEGSWVWSTASSVFLSPSTIAGSTLVGGILGWIVRRMNWKWLNTQSHNVGWHIVLALGFGVAAWYFRAGVSLGDRYNYLVMLQEQRWLITSQPLSTLMFSLAHFILGRANWPAEASLSLVSCLAGVVWAFSMLRLAALFSDWRQPLLVICGLFAGGGMIFFGYVELMAWPLALATLYVYLAHSALRGQHSVWAALVAGLAVACHGQMLILGPSIVVLAIPIWQLGRRWSVLSLAAATLAPIVLSLSVAFFFPERIFGSIYGDALGGGDSSRLVPLFQTTTPYESYTLFSALHWVELANLLLQTGPWLAFTLIPAGVAAWRLRDQPIVWFYVSILAASLSFLFLWNPDLGLTRDWDLYTPPVMLALVISICLWPFGKPLLGGHIVLGAMTGLNLTLLAVTVTRFAPALAWDPWDADWMQLQHPLAVRYGNSIELIGFEIEETKYRSGAPLAVNVFLRTRQSVSVDYTAGMYLVSLATTNPLLLAQDDHRPQIPIPLTRPRFTSSWLLGEVAQERYAVVIPASAPSGVYELWLALYDLNTLQRLFVGDADHVRLIEITIDGE